MEKILTNNTPITMQYIDNNTRHYPTLPLMEIAETTEEWYDNFLECMPPYRYNFSQGWFMCGEPSCNVTYNGIYAEAYLLCFREHDHYYTVLVPGFLKEEEIMNMKRKTAWSA